MTENQVTVAMEKFRPFFRTNAAGEIVSDMGGPLRPELQAAREDCFDTLMNLKLKRRSVTILLAIFLGGVGAARFYIGDTRMGVIRLLATILINIFSFVAGSVLGIILTLISFGWVVVDIFFAAKRVRVKNYETVSTFLNCHRAR